MFQQCEEPRFTIQQIDLLQRLRRTGITPVEVVHALDTLDHLEQKHEHKLSRKSSYRPPSSSTVLVSSSMMSTATQTSFPDTHLSLSPTNNFDTTFPPLQISVASPVPTAAVAENGLPAATNGKLSPPRFPLGVVGGAVMAPGFGFDTNEEDIDVEEKVEELMRRDSSLIKEEIKLFLANRRISQAVVAQVTGISQSRISHWLLQQGSDLSEQKKRAFFRWYQLERSNPGATLAMRSAPLGLDEIIDWQQAPAQFGPAPTGFRLRRGSRFTWRKECLAVMESFFSDNQYPDEAKREEIAAACNSVIQKPGKKLSDLERVTSLKVYNWFANRRKDIKRRANIEAAILESHGIEVQSPGGQSNSDEVDGSDFPDQACEVSLFDKRAPARHFGFGRADLSSPTLVPMVLPSGFPVLGRAGLSGQRAALIGRPQAAAAGTGVSWSPPSPSLQEEPGMHLSEPQDPISLQKTAVSHSGPAPANQERPPCSNGNDIKTETLEDA
ncbi:homeobox-containing protein 1-like isoform X1 [Takifugu flavidus]|uniref:Homeobox-containing protein 1 n=1 Tax=Takifugu flavidus TaxID=433684 RepID=A0A5C6NIW5_9TELE|nr:homeobox-containing protein 1-like isoform X1 [Takifugu flavidus]TWW67173.1 Homeobox-containing protein 1 [Takifugu flavidus]